ncbi:MAG: DUF1161 domain-containing protein [Burkholderiaceae bacterium]
MFKFVLPICLTLAGVGGAFAQTADQPANNCEPIRARIEANIASKGVSEFSVTVVDEAAPVSGEVVGQCDLGRKKIVYERGAPAAGAAAGVRAAPPPAAPSAGAAADKAAPKAPSADRGILTECKDGTVTMGGDCKR